MEGLDAISLYYVPSTGAFASDNRLARFCTDNLLLYCGFVCVFFLQHAVDVYNLIRVFVSAYVWMTGFGNFSFFYVRADYSFNR